VDRRAGAPVGYRAAMVDPVTAETFAPHRGSEFQVLGLPDADAGGSPILRLREVRVLGHQPHAPRTDPFALEFGGPAMPALTQGTYRLGHPELGELEIFLVPVEIDPSGELRYEAVFN
jgi:hypothetical protein